MERRKRRDSREFHFVLEYGVKFAGEVLLRIKIAQEVCLGEMQLALCRSKEFFLYFFFRILTYES